MASTVGTRRSPRFIEYLCSNTAIPSLSNEQTATLLSLAYCTGWSAEQIANKFAEATDVVVSPEAVWDYHWIWVNDRGFAEISVAEWDIMRVLMSNIGVVLENRGMPLSEFARPKTIKFAEQWRAKDSGGQPLFAGWTADCREASKGYLLIQKSYDNFGLMTPIEQHVMNRFGENMLHIFQNVLRRWARAMLNKVNEDPGLRPIKDHEHVDLIMDYLKKFQKLYEKKFGKMESGKPPSSVFGEIKDNTVFIRSTGYGVKVVLGLIMADRMCVIDMRRKLEREIIGFMEVEVEDLEHDSKNCPICQDPMGVECPDGMKEDPLRLVICCGQVLGAQCLRAWLGEQVRKGVYRNTCPHCRYKFPESFMKLLFSQEEYAKRIIPDHENFDLVSPSPEPVMVIRSQQEQDAMLREQLGEGVEGNVMDVDNAEQLRSASIGTGELIRPVVFERSAARQVELGELAEDEVMGDDFDMEG